MRRSEFGVPDSTPDESEAAAALRRSTIIEDVHACAKGALENLKEARCRFDELLKYADQDADAAEDYVSGSRAFHALRNELVNVEAMTRGAS